MAQETVIDSEPPSVHAGDWLVTKLRTKIQFDFSGSQPEIDDRRDIFKRRRLRVGVDGTLFRDLDYSVTVEARKDDQFRDLFLKYRRLPYFQLQAGRFKIPFGLDQLTDSGELDFVQRSRIGSIIAPGRDEGVMVAGELLERKIRYWGGVFRHDGRNSEIRDFAAINEHRPGGSGTLAARITIQPGGFLPLEGALRNLQVGTAFTRSHVASGLSSMSGVTASNEVFFPRMYVRGIRLRHSGELSLLWRSLSINGEFMDVREQRLGQGLTGENLPALRTQGWYLSATHPLIGHIDRIGRQSSFLRSILPGKTIGLFEVVARYEMIRFRSDSSAGSLPSRSPRAANVAPNHERAWTFGINWHANPYLKFQLNGVREMLRDPVRTPIDGQHRYWTITGRSQVFF